MYCDSTGATRCLFHLLITIEPRCENVSEHKMWVNRGTPFAFIVNDSSEETSEIFYICDFVVVRNLHVCPWMGGLRNISLPGRLLAVKCRAFFYQLCIKFVSIYSYYNRMGKIEIFSKKKIFRSNVLVANKYFFYL